MGIIRKILAGATILFYVFLSEAIASGSYFPSGSPQTKTSYTQGKAIYHGRVEIEGFPGCISCHDTNLKLKKKNFKKVGLVVDSYLAHCEEQKECNSANITNIQWEALMYFLQKRYRIE